MTLVTSGPLFAGSLPSIDLQSRLESKLVRLTAGRGSTEYRLTWKSWDIGPERRICALRASVPRKSASGCGGWATATTNDAKNCAGPSQHKGRRNSDALNVQATLVSSRAGWRTQTAAEAKNQEYSNQVYLQNQAQMVDRDGWKTPSGHEPGVKVERLVDSEGRPWAPGRRAYDKDTGRLCQTGLAQTVRAAGWPTATAGDAKSSGSRNTATSKANPGLSLTDAVRQDGGMGRPSGASAPTGSSGESQLNPFFALWLMGYPVEWGYCGVRAMQSYRK